MADKNLHDLKIDDLDTSKKTPLKNILTLLALLFIILVISVVITKLILNTDEGQDINDSITKSELATNIEGSDANKSSLVSGISNHALAAAGATVAAGTAAVAAKNVLERNLTSQIKDPLRTHQVTKAVKEIKEVKEVAEVKKTPKTYKLPKHPQAQTTGNSVHASTKKTPKLRDHTAVVHHSATPKKEYADKVIVKKAPKSSTSHRTVKKHTTTKHTTTKHTTTRTTTKHTTTRSSTRGYRGGVQKKLSHSYYIKVGTYKSPKNIVRKIKKINYNYSLQKVSGSSITRVFVGPFFSKNEASKNLARVQKSVLKDAFITKVKP